MTYHEAIESLKDKDNRIIKYKRTIKMMPKGTSLQHRTFRKLLFNKKIQLAHYLKLEDTYFYKSL